MSARCGGLAGSDAMYWADVVVSIVMVSIVFRLICPVRFCDCCGCAGWVVDAIASAGVDRGVFAEEVGFSGCG